MWKTCVPSNPQKKMGKSHCLGLQSRFFCGHVAIVIGPIGGPYPNDSQRMELNSQWLYHASVQITPTAYSYAYHHGMSHPPLPPPGELLIPCLFWK